MFGRHRENTDFLVLALSVIFLFRTFVAEPFQVPTGSMGPTLLGRHKELTCPHCSYPVICSSSDEIDLETGASWQRLVRTECPNCRSEIDISNVPSKDGDRILVFKNPPGPYQRFDIAVFKNIDAPRTPFVKRLVGLPGETIRLNRGEVEKQNGDRWEICRKTPEQVLATAVLVYDDRYPAKNGPARWQSHPDDAWQREGNRYRLQATGPEPSLLAYRHLPHDHLSPRLITDDLGYNSALSDTEMANPNIHRTAAGHPVSDLLLELTVEAIPKDSQFAIELQAGSHQFRYAIERSREFIAWNGREVWSRNQGAEPRFELRFGHVDNQLLLWKNNALSAWIPLEEGASGKGPMDKDLQPVSLLGTGPGLTVSDLVLRRDIYYTRRSQASDYFRPTVGAREMDAFLRDPDRWKRLRDIAPQAEPWKLGAGEYIALGDNSLQSNDSRHWRHGPIVDEKMILGRAEWFLWPVSHGRPLRIR